MSYNRQKKKPYNEKSTKGQGFQLDMKDLGFTMEF